MHNLRKNDLRKREFTTTLIFKLVESLGIRVLRMRINSFLLELMIYILVDLGVFHSSLEI